MLANSVDPDHTPRFSMCLVKKHDGQNRRLKSMNHGNTALLVLQLELLNYCMFHLGLNSGQLIFKYVFF